MSLEESILALAASVDAHTDALQHLAATLRTSAPPAAAVAAAAAAPGVEKRPPGRPPKNNKEAPPASPLEQAAAASSEPAQSAASSAGKTPSAGSSSTPSAPPSGTYADLQVLVPQLAEAQGRAAAVAIFAELGVASGKQLQAEKPELIGKAVKLFRAALEG